MFIKQGFLTEYLFVITNIGS